MGQFNRRKRKGRTYKREIKFTEEWLEKLRKPKPPRSKEYRENISKAKQGVSQPNVSSSAKERRS